MSDVSKRSGGADFNANDIDIGGSVVGRDQIISNVTNYCGAAMPTAPLK